MQVCGWESIHMCAGVSGCTSKYNGCPRRLRMIECLGEQLLCVQKPYTAALLPWVTHWSSLREGSVSAP